MNKKTMRTGVFSFTVLLALAVASPITASAHGFGSQKTMEDDKYSHHMQNQFSWDKNENQESNDWNHSMHYKEERSLNRENMQKDDTFSGDSCRTNSRNRMHKNSRMMKLEGWSDSMMNHHSFNGGNIEDNR